MSSEPGLALSPVTHADAAFLAAVLCDSRAAELAALALDEDARQQFVQLQLRAQRSHYARAHPGAVDHVVRLAGQPVGRCWTHHRPDALHLLDLAVLSGWRRQGLATRVLTLLKLQASTAGVPLVLSVWSDNAAARVLYARAGFMPIGEPDRAGQLHLVWSAPLPAGV